MSNGIGGLGGGLLDFTKNLQESSETNEEKKAKLLEIINNMGTPSEIEAKLSEHSDDPMVNIDAIRRCRAFIY